MRIRKSWFKITLILAVIVAVVGCGVYAVSVMDDEHGEQQQAYDHTYKVTEQNASHSGEHGSNGEDRHYFESEDQAEAGHHGHHEDGWDAAMAASIGGTILGAGVIYWIMRRKNRSNWTLAGHAAVMMPTTSEFLDKWETDQTNAKVTN
ncbi:hypothetical protein ACFFSY_22500 [Paenibacillus aurantiacus]|uniref:Uncharacterized protein n=1 Tax=Paenibacillus aurantiacus TaxID=1936118 RepID=A0ABV5KU07_9BACL